MRTLSRRITALAVGGLVPAGLVAASDGSSPRSDVAPPPPAPAALPAPGDVPDDRPLGVYTVPFDAASLAQAGALSGLTVALTGNARDFVISTERIPVASSVATEDTVLFGFGIEALATQEERASVLGAALRHLLG